MKATSFQIILILVFIVSFIVAILVFAGVIPIGSSSKSTTDQGTVTIWGVYPQDSIQGYTDQLTIQNPDLSIVYSEVDQSTLKTTLTVALADGRAPDIIIADSSTLFSIKDRLYTIPYETYNERLYRDTFIDGSSIFLTGTGVIALPLLVDPVVVYYNKDLLAGQNYVVPPTTWTGLMQSIPRFMKKDARGTTTQTAIAMGEIDNIKNFKDILSVLFLQTGNSIVKMNASTGAYESQIGLGREDDTQENDQLGTAKALDFYTGFANPSNSAFTWTRSLPDSLEMFLSGKSAFYIGRASELFSIQSRNPNLSFDVATIFQADGSVRPITYGAYSGLGIIKTSPNFTAAYNVAGSLTSTEFVQYLSSATSLPSVRRDQLLVAQKNPYVQTFYKAALSAFDWADIDPLASGDVFREMVRAVNGGRLDSTQAVYEAQNDLKSIIR